MPRRNSKSVSNRHRFVDDELQIEGRRQREQLDRDGQDQDLRQRPFQSGEAGPQAAQPGSGPGHYRLEVGGGGQFQRDAGEVVGYAGERIRYAAAGRVENDETVAANFLQHHEMIHVPMQDRGQGNVFQAFGFEPQGPGAERKLFGDLHQVAQARAPERGAEPLPHGVQIDLVTVVLGHHGQRRQTAFGRFGLEYGVQCRAPDSATVGQKDWVLIIKLAGGSRR